MRVVGIYSARLQATEEMNVYLGRETLQKMLKIDDRVSQVAMTG